MDFALDEDHRALQQEVGRFAEQEVAPGAEARDKEGRVPDELRAKMAEMGLFGIAIPDRVRRGGDGLLSLFHRRGGNLPGLRRVRRVHQRSQLAVR